MIRNVSQTAQEREIVKTAPDIIVYLDGTPYLLNFFVNDRRTGQAPATVNFNDFVTSFSCSYDTDIMIPNATVNLVVPNQFKYLFQMPGGNNLVQPMMQIQVYAKAYFMSQSADTVYRRMFKGLVSHVGYNDNGKTLDISVQCYGTLYMLQLMQINLSPSLLVAAQTGSAPTYFQTIFASLNPYQQIAAALTYGLHTDAFELNNITQSAASQGRFAQAVKLGYINKWQAILSNLAKDVHIFGVSYKDAPTKNNINVAEDKNKGTGSKEKQAAAMAVRTTKKESDMATEDIYYNAIQQYTSDRKVADVSLLNNQIVSRIELVRKMLQMIDFEGYQDIDGKIIIKPPLYNLDVLNLGSQVTMTSIGPTAGTQNALNPTGAQSRSNQYTDPLTAITPQTNPFVVYLAEILTEQESEDQAAVRRTRTVVSGNVDVKLQFGYNEELLDTSEYIDVGKLIKFGLREEPVIYTPWFKNGNISLFAHAVAETVRANRGYRTYTVTIPLRPELKLGFPIFFPHRDMYGYIKSINVNYQTGATATMTIVCDSIRRRVLVNTTQTDPALNQQQYFTSAPDLVLKWTKNPPALQANPNQSPLTDATNQYVQQQAGIIFQGATTASTQNAAKQNPTNLRGTPVTIASPQTAPTSDQQKIRARTTKDIKGGRGTASDVSDGGVIAQYFIQNDGDLKAGTVPASPPVNIAGQNPLQSNFNTPSINVSQTPPASSYYFKRTWPNYRLVDKSYINDIMNGIIPYTDSKGYEVLAPFPWGRYSDLITAINDFTQNGWIKDPTSFTAATPGIDPQDLLVLQNTDAFLYAGLGTPTSTGSAVDTLKQKFNQITNNIGGTFAPANASKPSSMNVDATVIVLQYNNTPNDSQLLNNAQPEDALIYSLVRQTQNAAQQKVDVLVSGSVTPIQNVQEAMLASQTQTPLNNVSVGATPGQQAQAAREFAGVPASDSSAG